MKQVVNKVNRGGEKVFHLNGKKHARPRGTEKGVELGSVLGGGLKNRSKLNKQVVGISELGSRSRVEEKKPKSQKTWTRDFFNLL